MQSSLRQDLTQVSFGDQNKSKLEFIGELMKEKENPWELIQTLKDFIEENEKRLIESLVRFNIKRSQGFSSVKEEEEYDFKIIFIEQFIIIQKSEILAMIQELECKLLFESEDYFWEYRGHEEDWHQGCANKIHVMDSILKISEIINSAERNELVN